MSSIRWDTAILKFALFPVLAFVFLAFTPSPASAAGTISVTVSYSVSGSGTGYGAPLFNYMSNGAPQTIQLPQFPYYTILSIDQGSFWSLSPQLPGSNATVSWATRSSSGKASPTMPGVFVFYHQALVNLGYTAIGGGRPIIRANFTQYGILEVNKAAGTSVWLDFQSAYTYAQIVDSSVPGERWIAPGSTDGQVIGPVSLDVVYYHQYLITAEYGTWGGNPSGVPSISGTSEGVPVSAPLTNFFSLVWLDAQTQYQATPAINVNTGERWAASGTTGTVTAAAAIIFTYYHQYSITANYNLVGGASPGQPLIVFSSGGTVVSQPLPLSSTQLWIDAGASYGLPLDLPGTSSVERWILVGPQWSNAVNSPVTASPTYYHQYAYQIGYSTVGSGAFLAPTISLTSFGASGNTTLGQSIFWADSGAAVAITQSEPGPDAGTIWRLGTQVPTFAQAPFTTTAVYYLQTQVHVSYQIVGGGSPPVPGFSYTSLGIAVTTNLAATGSYWADSGSAWSVQPVMQGITGERWILQGGTSSGSVTNTLSLGLSYQHEYLVRIQTGKFGGGLAANSSGWFSPGHQVELSAIAADGWKFGQWVGSDNSTSNPTTLTLNAPSLETAIFYPRITVSAGSGGQVRVVAEPYSGVASASNPFITYVYPGSEVTVYAMSSRLFQFTAWSGTSDASQNPLTLTVAGPTVIDARFDVSAASYALLIAAIAAVAVAGYFAFILLRRRGVRFPGAFDRLGYNRR